MNLKLYLFYNNINRNYMHKLAFCFLTYDNLSKPELWNIFFGSIDKNKYNIYLNNKYNFRGEYDKYIIKNRYINTKWGDISLIIATIKLLECAFNDIDNEYFILLSDKCIPLYNFNIIYNKIIEVGKSWVYTYNGSCVDYAKLSNLFEHKKILRNSQWVLLKRDIVNFIINNKNIIKLFNDVSIPDEIFFGYLFTHYNFDYYNCHMTYVKWENNRPHPKSYDDITSDIINFTGESLFIRKIPKNCKIDKKHYINIQTKINFKYDKFMILVPDNIIYNDCIKIMGIINYLNINNVVCYSNYIHKNINNMNIIMIYYRQDLCKNDNMYYIFSNSNNITSAKQNIIILNNSNHIDITFYAIEHIKLNKLPTTNTGKTIPIIETEKMINVVNYSTIDKIVIYYVNLINKNKIIITNSTNVGILCCLLNKKFILQNSKYIDIHNKQFIINNLS